MLYVVVSLLSCVRLRISLLSISIPAVILSWKAWQETGVIRGQI